LGIIFVGDALSARGIKVTDGYEAGLRQFRQHARMVSAPETGADDSETNFVHLHSQCLRLANPLRFYAQPFNGSVDELSVQAVLDVWIFGCLLYDGDALQSFTPASRSSSTEDTTPWVSDR